MKSKTRRKRKKLEGNVARKEHKEEFKESKHKREKRNKGAKQKFKNRLQ